MPTVTVIDETTAGERASGPKLAFLTESVTVRELIRSRVYQEVTEHNARKALGHRTLIDLSPRERALNAETTSQPRRVDWERQFERALSAFEGNGFLLFAGNRQLLKLDEEVELGPDTELTFLRLVPLVGG